MRYESVKATFKGYEAESYLRIAEAWDGERFEGAYVHSEERFVTNPEGDVVKEADVPKSVLNLLNLMLEEQIKDLQEQLDVEAREAAI